MKRVCIPSLNRGKQEVLYSVEAIAFLFGVMAIAAVVPVVPIGVLGYAQSSFWIERVFLWLFPTSTLVLLLSALYRECRNVDVQHVFAQFGACLAIHILLSIGFCLFLASSLDIVPLLESQGPTSWQPQLFSLAVVPGVGGWLKAGSVLVGIVQIVLMSVLLHRRTEVALPQVLRVSAAFMLLQQVLLAISLDASVVMIPIGAVMVGWARKSR